MAEPRKPLRCIDCRAPDGAMVHHVRGAAHCYVPQGCVILDPKVHAPAVEVVLGSNGRCGVCSAAKVTVKRTGS